MTSAGTYKKKRKKSFRLKEALLLDVNTITKIARERKKCGLIMSNCAELPLWMTDDDFMDNSKNIIVKRHKPAVFDHSPLKGTFTDGFAMYSTFCDVENTEVQFGINMSGKEYISALTQMFNKTKDGVQDFFIYYSGTAKSYNGDWMCYDEDNDHMDIIPINKIIKKWQNRPSKNKNQYLLIITDTNYSGIWVSKTTDRKLLQKENILIQSSVHREGTSLEMTIGEIKPPCWVMQIICGKFTHSWLEICQSEFYKIKDAVIDMKGSFVILNKKLVWDNNPDYNDEINYPMANTTGPYDEKTIICIPCYGYGDLVGDDVDDAMEMLKDGDIEQELQNVLDEIKNDDNEESKGVTFTALKKGGNNNNLGGGKKRTSHLPQPSVRRLNLLQGVVGGLKLKHAKKKSRHVSTYSRGFIFSKVLTDIRQLVMGSDSEQEDVNDNNKDWIDD